MPRPDHPPSALRASPPTRGGDHDKGRSMSRWLVALIALVVLGAVTIWSAPRLVGQVAPIRVGLLHSRTGPMASSERSMIDAEVLAVEEIHAAGGLLGRPLEVVIADG